MIFEVEKRNSFSNTYSCNYIDLVFDFSNSFNFPEKMRLDKLSSGKPLAFPQALLAETKKEFSKSPLDMGASVSRKRKKIFGVEISEENDDPINNAKMLDEKDENHGVLSSSWIDNSFMQSLHLRGANMNERSKTDTKCELISSKERFSNHYDMQGKWLEGCSSVDKVPYQHNTNNYLKNVDNMDLPIQVWKKDSQHSQGGGLPWFLRNSQVGDDQSNGKKNSWYFMNLDSLQNCSQKFFGKAERPNDTFQTSKNINEVNDGTSAKQNLGFPISDVLQGSSIGGMSDLRHCIDLNLSLDDEDAPSAPYLPPAVVKMATTEIDLEASIVIESPKGDESKNLELECDKIAAEAMMAISALSPESGSIDSLKWFAEIVCVESSTIPDGMDYFEYMTLKLEDTKKEDYHYEPFVLNSPSGDETGATQTKRSRRRGRQRKDFQRGILPGLVTLSRLQVTEDFQAFDELLKAGGLSQRSSSRNGRGRRRPGGATTSPMVKTHCSTEAEQPICQLEERSTLAGWGKRTRRLPRQRCPNAFLSFPVKC